MSTSRLLISTLVGFIYLFVIEYVWYGVMGMGGGDEETMPIWHWMILGYLVFAFVFSYMYPKGVEGSSAVQEGLRFGVLVAFLVFVSQGLMWLALPEFLVEEPTLNQVIIDALFHIVECAVLGIVVAQISDGDNSKRGDIGSGKTREKDAPPPPPTGAVG